MHIRQPYLTKQYPTTQLEIKILPKQKRRPVRHPFILMYTFELRRTSGWCLYCYSLSSLQHWSPTFLLSRQFMALSHTLKDLNRMSMTCFFPWISPKGRQISRIFALNIWGFMIIQQFPAKNMKCFVLQICMILIFLYFCNNREG